MSFVQNFPCFSILSAMFAAILTSAVNGKTARKISIGLTALLTVMSAALLVFLMGTGESYVYVMGHFPAPWGNELRAGELEAGLALLFSIVALGALLGGAQEALDDIDDERENFYFIMIDLMMAANLALVYTNDMFTAYVFVEINTIAACGLILGKYKGVTIAAAVRYMIMSLMGSGMLLLGISFFYSMTGQLLMSNMKEALAVAFANEQFQIPLVITIGMICIGLAIKSALWPFHTWLPAAYGFSTTISAALLSSIVSKGYIIFLMKVVIRVIGLDNFVNSQIVHVLLVFGIIGMIMGSVQAIRQTNLRKMIAYSSVAQIGYIYMGMGMGSLEGMGASIYHIFAHALAKSLMFIAASGLIKACGSASIRDMVGAGYKNKIAALGYAIASFSMIGIPGFAGFASKFLFAKASLADMAIAPPVLAALAVSTILNAMYFMKVMLHLYFPLNKEQKAAGATYQTYKNTSIYVAAVVLLSAANIVVGVCYKPMAEIIFHGLEIFG